MSRLNTAYHNMAVHLSMGVLLALVIVVIAIFILNMRKQDTELLKKLDGSLPALLFLGIAGTAIAFISPLADYPAWSALVASPLIKMKISLAFIIFEIFLMMYYIHWKKGPAMWKNQKLAIYFLVLAIGGASLLSIVGAIGGFITIHETSMEAILNFIGVAIP
ncbi:hypothetical protein [Syntrophomonas erecta]